MNHSQKWIIPLFLFLLSLAVRLFLISKGPYHGDCLYLAIQAQKTVLTSQLHYLHQHGYPLTALTGAVFVFVCRLFSVNDPIRAVNLMSVLATSLCIPALYALTRKFFGSLTAFLTAFLFSFSPIFLSNSVYGNSHGLSLLFLLLGINALAGSSRHRFWFVVPGFLVGLSGAARLGDLVVMIVPLVFLISLFRDNNEEHIAGQRKWTWAVRDNVLFFLIVLLTLKLFYDPIIQNKSISQYLRKDVFSLFVVFLPPMVDSAKYFLTNFTVFGLVCAAAGFFILFFYDKKIFGFLGMWFLVSALIMGATLTVMPRYFIVSIVPLYMAQGFLLARFIQQQKPMKNKVNGLLGWIEPRLRFAKRIGEYRRGQSHATHVSAWSSMKINFLFRCATLLIFALLAYSSFSYIFPILKLRHERELLPDYVRWVAKITAPQAKIIFPDGSIFLSYYGPREALARPFFFFGFDPEALKRFKSELDGYLERGIPVYITEIGLKDYDVYGKFAPFMEENYRLEIVGRKPYEEYHTGEIYQKIFSHVLMQIHKK